MANSRNHCISSTSTMQRGRERESLDPISKCEKDMDLVTLQKTFSKKNQKQEVKKREEEVSERVRSVAPAISADTIGQKNYKKSGKKLHTRTNLMANKLFGGYNTVHRGVHKLRFPSFEVFGFYVLFLPLEQCKRRYKK